MRAICHKTYDQKTAQTEHPIAGRYSGHGIWSTPLAHTATGSGVTLTAPTADPSLVGACETANV